MPGDPPFGAFASPLDGHLMDARTLMVSESISASTTGSLTQRLAALASESDAPIRLLLQSADGGEVAAALSVYDLIRSLGAPVTVLAGGPITGPSVLVVLAPPRDRRFALPHARFRLEFAASGPQPRPARDPETQAEAAAADRDRMITLLAERTDRASEKVQEDLVRRRTLDAEAVVTYGLIGDIVENRRALE